MAHQRIRLTQPTAATGSYSKAVLAGNTLYISGQTGAGLDGSPPVLGDPAAQARQACENVKVLLAEAGGDFSHAVKLTVYITDRAFREPVYAVIGEYFGRMRRQARALSSTASLWRRFSSRLTLPRFCPDRALSNYPASHSIAGG